LARLLREGPLVEDGRSSQRNSEPAPELPVVPGQLIGGRYLIGSIIGEGGMGVVCSATHVGLGTQVAVKLIRSDQQSDSASVERFLNEARTAASLKGEHIARVYDVGQLESGEPYLVMEQLEGVGLDSFIAERGPLSQGEAIDIVLQACEGLAEAHAVALVHRDIKPANLFLARRPDGELTLKILDFGISKRLVDSALKGLTEPGRSLGSPSYMSPEQMLDASLVDQRADVWSLGILLFELLTKQCPFGGASVPQVCAAVLTALAPVPSEQRSDIDAGLDAVVLRCLAKDPNDRYSSVAALAEALKPFVVQPVRSSGLAFAETRAFGDGRRRTAGSLSSFLVRPARQRPRWSAVMTVAVLVMGAAMAWLAFSDAGKYESRFGSGGVSAFRLPWDPVLGPAPEGEALRARADASGQVALQLITAKTAVPEAGMAEGSVETSRIAVVPTTNEVSLQVERSRIWQREQKRIEGGDAPHDVEDQTPNDGEAKVEHPNDDP
jgi:eukaryotic-like serine/threonine-protein kinase